jgi:hypothetical protein
MRFWRVVAFTLLFASIHLVPHVQAREATPDKPLGWAYLRGGEVRSKPKLRNRGFLSASPGLVAPVLKLQTKQGGTWARIRVFDLKTANAQPGWVEEKQMEFLPAERFPADAVLLRELGGPYLDDFTAAHAEISRFLVRQGGNDAALVCFVISRDLPTARLVAFLPVQGKFVPGPALEFPFAEMSAGIVAAEVRDLLGDGNECLIIREPFHQGPEARGVKVVILRIVRGRFQTLWEAPAESRNLTLFPPRPQVLQPPEKNIGAPGTVTKGEVAFRPNGSVQEPVWKGRVEFYVVGRDQPVQSIPIEKVCPWQGTGFAPLR